MNQETQALVLAIEGLKQDPNYIKDYIFPIVSAFFSSILGAWIANLALNKQEKLKLEKEKLIAANKWILEVDNARSSLIAIKGNYHNQLKSHPFQRLAAIPSILLRSKSLVENFQDLAFIIPSKEEQEKQPNKWSQIPRINAMVSNYNSLLVTWEKRNEINEKFKAAILNKNNAIAFANISMQDAEAVFGRTDLVLLINFTEHCIKLTDDLIIELSDFLDNFPAYVKTKIDLKRLKNFGKLINYSNDDNQILLDLIKPEVTVDFSYVSTLFGESEEDLSKRHTTGYE